MIDKLKTYFDNNKWFRILCYVVEFFVWTYGLCLMLILCYHIVNYIIVNGDIGIYSTNDVLCFGAMGSVCWLETEIEEYIKRVYNRITNRNKIDN